MAGLAFTLARLRFTGDVRFILANCSGVSGRASGSANAAAVISSSVIAITRSQFVSSGGRLSRRYRTILEVARLLISISPTGAYDANSPGNCNWAVFGIQ
jgi:hypothetical protein